MILEKAFSRGIGPHPAIRSWADIGPLLLLRLCLRPRVLLLRLRVLLLRLRVLGLRVLGSLGLGRGGQPGVLCQLLVAAAPAVRLPGEAPVCALQLSHARLQDIVLLLQLGGLQDTPSVRTS